MIEMASIGERSVVESPEAFEILMKRLRLDREEAKAQRERCQEMRKLCEQMKETLEKQQAKYANNKRSYVESGSDNLPYVLNANLKSAKCYAARNYGSAFSAGVWLLWGKSKISPQIPTYLTPDIRQKTVISQYLGLR